MVKMMMNKILSVRVVVFSALVSFPLFGFSASLTPPLYDCKAVPQFTYNCGIIPDSGKPVCKKDSVSMRNGYIRFCCAYGGPAWGQRVQVIDNAGDTLAICAGDESNPKVLKFDPIHNKWFGQGCEGDGVPGGHLTTGCKYE